MTRFQIGPFTISSAGIAERIDGQTMGGQSDVGMRQLFECRHPGWAVTLAWTWWVGSREGDVRMLVDEKSEAPAQVVSSLGSGRLRLGVNLEQSGQWSTVLRMATERDQPGHATLRKVVLSELDSGSGLHVNQELKRLGATKVGLRSELDEEVGARWDYVKVIWPEDNLQVPLAAFILSRILPLSRV